MTEAEVVVEARNATASWQVREIEVWTNVASVVCHLGVCDRACRHQAAGHAGERQITAKSEAYSHP